MRIRPKWRKAEAGNIKDLFSSENNECRIGGVGRRRRPRKKSQRVPRQKEREGKSQNRAKKQKGKSVE